jgi:hypothetical protein
MQLALALLEALDAERPVYIDSGERGHQLADEQVVLLASILLQSHPSGHILRCRIAEMAGKKCYGSGSAGRWKGRTGLGEGFRLRTSSME